MPHRVFFWYRLFTKTVSFAEMSRQSVYKSVKIAFLSKSIPITDEDANRSVTFFFIFLAIFNFKYFFVCHFHYVFSSSNFFLFVTFYVLITFSNVTLFCKKKFPFTSKTKILIPINGGTECSTNKKYLERALSNENKKNKKA